MRALPPGKAHRCWGVCSSQVKVSDIKASEMALQVKALAEQAGGLSLIPKDSHKCIRREPTKLSSDKHVCTVSCIYLRA